ncbi:telomere binding protein [Coemansia sp. RSA 2599]|nr:telomere binding protein [Coemansia sp. RSA 2598]KAJ1829048.1 telomere binding protein [Coemansia sp. RSA 2599]
MSLKQTLRAFLKTLEARVSQLTSDSVTAPDKVPLDSKMQSLTIDDSRESEEIGISISIPGIGRPSGSIAQSLITPIDGSRKSKIAETPATHVGPTIEAVAAAANGSSVEEIKSVLQTPLILLGVRDKSLLDQMPRYQWTADAIKLADACGVSDGRHLLAQLIGPWFARAVIGDASDVVLRNQWVDGLIKPYFLDLPDQASWPIVVSTLGVLASAGRKQANSGDASSLSLCTCVLQLCVGHGLLDPQRHLAEDRWPEYLGIACSVPERVANRVDPRDIPEKLRPSEYFMRLARITAGMDHGGDGRIGDLWSKLCRTGHVGLLSKEITALLLDEQHCSTAAQRVARHAGVFSERLVRAVVLQLDAGLAVCDDLDSEGLRAAAAICWMAHALVEAGHEKDDVVAWLIGDGRQSLATNGAVALALMALSGCARASDAGDAWLARVPSRVYPSLLAGALTRVVIPQWSFREFLERASTADMRAATALVLACVGALSDRECGDVAVSAEFMQAVPRFLDSPIPVVKLSGILVADQVARRGAKKMGEGDEEQQQQLDFGLDDVIANARASQNQALLASARYVEQMQGFVASPLSLWRQASGGGDSGQGQMSQTKSLSSAVESLADDGGGGVRAQAQVFAPRQASLTDGGASTELQSAFVRPRKPMFLGDCIKYMRETKDGGNELVSLALFASVECIDRAGDKALREHWVALANRVLYAYNRGKDELDLLWNDERRRVLARLAVRLPELVGPFLADRSCDRNLTLKDREIVFAAISSACIELAGVGGRDGQIEEIEGEGEGEGEGKDEDEAKEAGSGETLAAGTVVRRSRRLDLIKRGQQQARSSNKQALARRDPSAAALEANSSKYPSIVGPAFFFPLISQYGKSDYAPDTVSDVRRDIGQLEKLLNTLGVILYTAGSATHLIAMDREFWHLAKLVRLQLGDDQPLPVVDALLFGIDVILDPQRALSVPTLAREFRSEMADTLRWIDLLAERGLLRSSAMAHAARIVERLQEIQDQVGQRMRSGDFDQFSSII